MNIKKILKYKRQIKLIAFELLIVALLIAADLVTKVYIYGAAKTGGDITIIKGVIKFVAEENTGASFGMLKDMTNALGIFSAICTAALIAFLIYTINNRHKLFRAALILIIGGAAGNLYDRFALGYVRDFVYFELINYAVFNFADSALVVGCIIFIIYVLFYYNEKSGFASSKQVKEGGKRIDNALKEAAVEKEENKQPQSEKEGTIQDEIKNE